MVLEIVDAILVSKMRRQRSPVSVVCGDFGDRVDGSYLLHVVSLLDATWNDSS